MGHYLLIFMIQHCFTGAYISFLNKPIMEKVSDTKERLLAFLRDGRLQPCVLKHSLELLYMTSLKNPSMTLLKHAVRNWPQFAEDTMDACAERARRRQAVYLGQLYMLERFTASFQGQVQTSRAHSEDSISPSSLVIPKASPYKQLLDNA
ncbi:hypothetical protein HPB50_011722 [Hyalomma asiaticum]|uniref:Uncharacterized protein n=1 Tax=Hyalomma asiaticum TaxID=266040 RepID=A0ACB7RN86_HYAAI|nr:hypothetical protein HPB50_011722 [Hyalomma asiaticum]